MMGISYNTMKTVWLFNKRGLGKGVQLCFCTSARQIQEMFIYLSDTWNVYATKVKYNAHILPPHIQTQAFLSYICVTATKRHMFGRAKVNYTLFLETFRDFIEESSLKCES